MASLRIALKKSLEENSAVGTSSSKGSSTFIGYDEIFRASKPRQRKRTTSMDNNSTDEQPKKRPGSNFEDASTASLLTADEPQDEPQDDITDDILEKNCSKLENSEKFEDDSVVLDCDEVKMLDDQTDSMFKSESSIPEIQKSEDIDEPSEVKVEIIENLIDEDKSVEVEEMKTEEELDDSAIINDNETKPIIEATSEINEIEPPANSIEDQEKSVIDNMNEDSKVKGDDNESVEGIKKEKDSKKGKRRSGLLRALGITDLALDSIEEVNDAPESQRLPSRAAAVLAKNRIANKTPSVAPSANVSPRDEDNLNPPKKAEPIKKPAKKVAAPIIPAPATEEAPTEEAVVAPWACCDTCEKWRKLPKFVDPSTLPEKWFCHMNEWDPAHNSCDAPEESEETSAGTEDQSKEIAPITDESVVKPNIPETDNTAKASRSVLKAKKPQTSKSSNELSATLERTSSSAGLNSKNGLDATDIYSSSRLANKRRTSVGANQVNQTSSAGRTQSSGSVTEPDKVNWVQCNRCTKWRKVPSFISMESLPDTWLCEQNTWNPAYAKCSAKQEPETEVLPNQSSTLTRASSQNSLAAQRAGSNTTGNGQPGQTGPAKTITIQWVRCERKNCHKWRKIPPNINSEDLPEKWYCEFNTWDSERANCDAPEESDNENDNVDPAVVASRSLILANSKGPGALSYRRIIYGTDGKVRPIYSEKSKTGHGLFSFTERIIAVNRNSSQTDEVAYEEPLKRVSYWYSSHYDESGINYTSSSKSKPGTNPLSKPQIRLEELNQNFSDCPPDSALIHFATALIPSKINSESVGINSQPSLRHLWPKKLAKACDQVENATLFEQRELFISLIRSTMLLNENLSIPFPDLFEAIKTNYYFNPMINCFRHRVTVESLKLMLKFMEESGEIYVTTDSSGIHTIHYSKAITPNVHPIHDLSRCNLPPKLRGKKIISTSNES